MSSVLYAEAEPEKFEKGALRWLARYVSEAKPSLLEAQIALAALSDIQYCEEPLGRTAARV